METRPHPKLPPSSKIQWPHNQQVRYIVESVTKRRNTSSTEQHSQSLDCADEAVSKLTQKAQQVKDMVAIAPMATSAASVPTPSPAPRSGDSRPQDKVAITNIRKAHSQWDRASRDSCAIVAKSAVHENTAGCKFERDLQELINQGADLDAKLMALEQQYMGSGFADADVHEAGKLCRDLASIVAQAQKTKTRRSRRGGSDHSSILFLILWCVDLDRLYIHGASVLPPYPMVWWAWTGYIYTVVY